MALLRYCISALANSSPLNHPKKKPFSAYHARQPNLASLGRQILHRICSPCSSKNHLKFLKHCNGVVLDHFEAGFQSVIYEEGVRNPC